MDHKYVVPLLVHSGHRLGAFAAPEGARQEARPGRAGVGRGLWRFPGAGAEEGGVSKRIATAAYMHGVAEVAQWSADHLPGQVHA